MKYEESGEETEIIFFFAKTFGLYTNKSGISTNPINYIHKVKFFHILSLIVHFTFFFSSEDDSLFWFGFTLIFFHRCFFFFFRHNKIKMCNMKNAFKLGQRKKVVVSSLLLVEILKLYKRTKEKPLKKPLSRNGSSTQKDISYALY